jgi:hypothetical protein
MKLAGFLVLLALTLSPVSDDTVLQEPVTFEGRKAVPQCLRP